MTVLTTQYYDTTTEETTHIREVIDDIVRDLRLDMEDLRLDLRETGYELAGVEDKVDESITFAMDRLADRLWDMEQAVDDLRNAPSRQMIGARCRRRQYLPRHYYPRSFPRSY